MKLDSEDNVNQILFEIDNSELLFVAGKVYKDSNDIYILLEDESIWVFDDQSQIENVCFGRAIDLKDV